MRWKSLSTGWEWYRKRKSIFNIVICWITMTWQGTAFNLASLEHGFADSAGKKFYWKIKLFHHFNEILEIIKMWRESKGILHKLDNNLSFKIHLWVELRVKMGAVIYNCFTALADFILTLFPLEVICTYRRGQRFMWSKVWPPNLNFSHQTSRFASFQLYMTQLKMFFFHFFPLLTKWNQSFTKSNQGFYLFCIWKGKHRARFYSQ